MRQVFKLMLPHSRKETEMLHKTIALQLLEQYPEIHEQLRNNRILLPTLELLAAQLKTRHEALKEMLSKSRPDSEPIQIASEAREIAVQELEDRLSSAFPQEDSEPFSLDAAMAFLRSYIPPA
jgi:hypothetical protein